MQNNITSRRFQLAIPRLILRFANQSECKILFINYTILREIQGKSSPYFMILGSHIQTSITIVIPFPFSSWNSY